jgi:hypothetical protein
MPVSGCELTQNGIIMVMKVTQNPTLSFYRIQQFDTHELILKSMSYNKQC